MARKKQETKNIKRGIIPQHALLIFVLFIFIIVLFLYFGYNLIKNLLLRGFQ